MRKPFGSDAKGFFYLGLRWFIFLLWFLAVVYGMWRVLNYEKTPGTALQAPAQWPVEAPVALAPTGATLV
ncbi:hypothetical protein, partial [Faecalibacillus intestinalis]|uniref:hypothetical protein n=1 Tax=Faecalibacillus intestinalis TaxID=1982626 RepID=UPI001EE013DF